LSHPTGSVRSDCIQSPARDADGAGLAALTVGRLAAAALVAVAIIAAIAGLLIAAAVGTVEHRYPQQRPSAL
jgi:hypothetical protein